MKQLAPLDAVFRSMETDTTTGTIGGIAVLDPSTHPDFDYDRLVEFIAERIEICPRFRWRVQEVPFGLDLPYWVETDDFDVRRHIRRLSLPGPGDQRDLADLAGFLFAQPLDFDKPLWEMFYLEGLQGGRVALVWKLHHSIMDGASGAGLIELLFDLQPEPGDRPLIPVPHEEPPTRELDALEMVKRAVANANERPKALRKHARSLLGEAWKSFRGEGRIGNAAPHTSFNGMPGRERSVAWSAVSLERVMALKSEMNVTVNDVVLAMSGSAIRRYLDERGELPAESLLASIPMSTRSADDKSIGNQVREMSVHWATDVDDPVERLLRIRQATAEAKQWAKLHPSDVMATIAEALPPFAAGLLARAGGAAGESMPLVGNAVVSNVKGAPIPMYLGGAKIVGMIPMSVLAPTQGLNVTVISYCGEIFFGFTVDPQLLPEPWKLADAIPKCLIELEEAAGRYQSDAA